MDSLCFTRVDRRGTGESLERNTELRADAFVARPGTVEYFLTERYCLYAQTNAGALLRGEIHHAPWLLQVAEAEFQENTMAGPRE